MKPWIWIIIIGAGILVLGVIAIIGVSQHLVNNNNTTAQGVVIGPRENYIHIAKGYSDYTYLRARIT